MRGLGRERVQRVGNRALVRLETLLADADTKDLRALVLAIRTGLDVSGLLKGEAAIPIRTVRELSVPELNELIDSTERELHKRITPSVPVIVAK